MWRIRSLVILCALVGVLLFGATAAYALHWSWNAELDVEGVDLRTAWSVEDAAGSGHFTYITLTLPDAANVTIVQVGSNESVTLKTNNGLACLSNGVEARVKYQVTGSPGGAEVSVTADGQVIGSDSGIIG